MTSATHVPYEDSGNGVTGDLELLYGRPAFDV
jgi:hypothetical protein